MNNKSNFDFVSNPICTEIYSYFCSELKFLGTSDRLLLNKYKDQMNMFCEYIHSNSERIHGYITSESKKNKKFIYNTESFKFKYEIDITKGSEFAYVYYKNGRKHFSPSFLKNRVKPRFGFVYLVQSEHGYKIGKTKNISLRMSNFSILLPFKFNLHSTVRCVEFNELELILHKTLSHKRLNGEWFSLEENDFKEIDIILSNMKLKRILVDETVCSDDKNENIKSNEL